MRLTVAPSVKQKVYRANRFIARNRYVCGSRHIVMQRSSDQNAIPLYAALGISSSHDPVTDAAPSGTECERLDGRPSEAAHRRGKGGESFPARDSASPIYNGWRVLSLQRNLGHAADADAGLVGGADDAGEHTHSRAAG